MPITNAGRVLIVDDEPDILKACAATLKMNGLRDVVSESDSRRVMEQMNSGRVDLVILDLFMPHVSGMDLLPQLRERFPHVPVVVVSESSELERAVECIKMGAFDYLVKPVENERLLGALRKAFDGQALTDHAHDQDDRLREDGSLDNPGAFAEIVTRSRKMLSLLQYLEVVARSSKPVLITGESGTGKELIARAIYRLCGFSSEMVSINLAGLDDLMFSDTLFGHKRGAFTGAEQPREGLVIRAAGGLLFLDEIGDLGDASQIRLLRLIQENEFYPLGSDTPRKCDARIICASNRDIKGMVAAGRFRNDLYFRLNVHHVVLPPLRERKEDIPLLLDHFIGQAAENLGITPPSYPKELLGLLATYHFPGNIRELQGMVIDAVACRQSKMLSQEPFRRAITRERPQQVLPATPAGDDESRQRMLEGIWGHFPTLFEADEFLIDTALRIAQGNQGIAATMLGLRRQTLNMRLKVRKRRA
jgi:two-component system response regulator HydG